MITTIKLINIFTSYSYSFVCVCVCVCMRTRVCIENIYDLLS